MGCWLRPDLESPSQLVKQCLGTIILDPDEGYFDISCDEVRGPTLGRAPAPGPASLCAPGLQDEPNSGAHRGTHQAACSQALLGLLSQTLGGAHTALQQVQAF